MKPISYGRQSITAEDLKAVTEVLQSDFLTQGPQVERFEQGLSHWMDGASVVAVANGTVALHLTALALGVQAGDRVLVVSNTFVASANCIRYCGAEVEFLDIDPRSYCVDLEQLRARLEAKPAGYYRGVVAVDFAGYVVDYEKLRKLADRFAFWIIEDACHALGGAFRTQAGEWSAAGSGRWADAAVFSFHPVKHIATGEGGAISTRQPQLLEKLRLLRSHGITRDPKQLQDNHGGWYYEMQTLGFNARMPDILCALGTSQLQRLEENLAARHKIAQRYHAELKGLPLGLPETPTSVRHAYHLFVIQTERRDELFRFLKEREIHCQVHYIPVHTQPYYRELYGTKSLPVVERYYQRALSLPMYHALSESDQSRVIEAVRKFFV